MKAKVRAPDTRFLDCFVCGQLAGPLPSYSLETKGTPHMKVDVDWCLTVNATCARHVCQLLLLLCLSAPGCPGLQSAKPNREHTCRFERL
jgi:hypothetical protein